MQKRKISGSRRLCFFMGAAVCALTPVVASAQSTPPANINIQAQSLASALTQLGRQTGTEVIFSPSVVAGKSAPAVRGNMSPDAAITQLIRGTGLRVRRTDQGSFVIEPVPDVIGDASNAAPSLPDLDENQRDSGQEVIVTGTNIRGVAPAGSPIEVFDRRDIQQSGAGTVERFMRTIPQNFSGGAGEGTRTSAANADARSNLGDGTAANLRGLGSGTTLVLLNGHRMAPAGSNGSFVDISMIPASAIERIEILTDGASAIYGSDAVGGVVNFVLRKDYEGFETGGRIGSDLRGLGEERFSQTAGTKWTRGSALISYEYYHRDALRAEGRDFAKDVPVQEATLIPSQRRHSIFATAAYEPTDRLKLSADVLYSDRKATNLAFNPSDNIPVPAVGKSRQFMATATAEYSIAGDWRVAVNGLYSRHKIFGQQGNPAFGLPLSQTNVLSKERSVSAILDGPIMSIGSGVARAVVGTSYRNESWNSFRRNVFSAFGELYIPFVAPADDFALDRIEISLAGRYDKYSDFGSSFIPKAGIRIDPNSFLSLRGSYSRSYRAPLLSQLDESTLLLLIAAPNPASPSGQSLTLYTVGSGNADLDAERARTWTAGFDLTPLSQTRISGTYYDIVFKNRITRPVFSIFEFLLDPMRFGSLIVPNPSADFVTAQISGADTFLNAFGPFAPADVEFFIDSRINNIAVERQRGIDLALLTTFEGSYGRFDVTVGATYILKLVRSVTATSLPSSALNKLESPVDLKARAGIAWSKNGFGASALVNYVNGYRNQVGNHDVPSWTTVDARLAYRVTNDRSVADGLTVALTAQNLFNAKPPHISGIYGDLGYDPANADPMGRLVAIEITKEW